MITNPALRRPTRHVVLHAVPAEHLHLPVVHLGGNRYFQDALRRAQNLPQALIELQVFRCDVELDLRDPVRIQILARRDARYRLRRRLRKRGHLHFLLARVQPRRSHYRIENL